jgi:hypothetical protein
MLRLLNVSAAPAQEDAVRPVQVEGYLRDRAVVYLLVQVEVFPLVQVVVYLPVRVEDDPLALVVAFLPVRAEGYRPVRAVDVQQAQEADAQQTRRPECGCRVTADRRWKWAGADTSYPQPVPYQSLIL